MPLPNIYNPIGEGAVASYDFGDIITGTAYQIFYLGETKEDSTLSYVLSPNEFYSHDIERATSITAKGQAAFTKVLDTDYDIPVNIPQTMYGVGIVSINVLTTDVVGNGVLSVYYIAKLRKWDGTTETDIATAQCETTGADGGTTKRICTVHLDIPKTHFAIGSTIRLTIEVWAKNADTSNNGFVAYGQDPKNREGAYLGANEMTQSVFYAPFKPDL